MIKAVLPKRGTDSWGSGAYEAPRGKRVHHGIDYACEPGQAILSPVTGKLTKIGYPYADDLSYRYIQIEDAGEFKHRIFYVQPDNENFREGWQFTEGDVIGKAQDLTTRYPGIKNHVHYEIISPGGKYVNPEEFK